MKSVSIISVVEAILMENFMQPNFNVSWMYSNIDNYNIGSHENIDILSSM